MEEERKQFSRRFRRGGAEGDEVPTQGATEESDGFFSKMTVPSLNFLSSEKKEEEPVAVPNVEQAQPSGGMGGRRFNRRSNRRSHRRSSRKSSRKSKRSRRR